MPRLKGIGCAYSVISAGGGGLIHLLSIPDALWEEQAGRHRGVRGHCALCRQRAADGGEAGSSPCRRGNGLGC